MSFCENALEVSFENWGSQEETLAVFLFKCRDVWLHFCLMADSEQLLIFLYLVSICHFYKLLKE